MLLAIDTSTVQTGLACYDEQGVLGDADGVWTDTVYLRKFGETGAGAAIGEQLQIIVADCRPDDLLQARTFFLHVSDEAVVVGQPQPPIHFLVVDRGDRETYVVTPTVYASVAPVLLV